MKKDIYCVAMMIICGVLAQVIFDDIPQWAISLHAMLGFIVALLVFKEQP